MATVTIHFPFHFSNVADADGSRSGLVAAIKAIRQLTGMGLREAKDIVDARGVVDLLLSENFDLGYQRETALQTLRTVGCFVGVNESSEVPVAQPELPSIDMLTIVIKRELDNNRFNVALRLMEVLAEHYSS